MIEIINIFLFPIFLLILFNNSYLIKHYGNKLEVIDIYSLNLFIILNFILILSFFNIKINLIIYFVFFYCILSNLIFFKINKNYIKIFLPLILIFYVLALSIVVNPDLGWDGKFHWYLRSLSFYQGFGIENLQNLPKYEYPHFGTFLWAFFWKLSLNNFEYFGRLFYLFLFLISIFSFTETFEIKKKFKIYIFSGLAIISFNLQNFLGNQDIIIFSLIVFLSKYFYLIFQKYNDNLFNYIMIFLISNIIIWIKYESIVFILILFFVILASKMILKEKKFFFITLLSLLTIIIIKISFNYFYDIGIKPTFQFSDKYDFNQLLNINEITLKFLFIIKYLLISIFKNPIMLPGLICLFLSLINRSIISKEIIITFVLFVISSFLTFFVIQNDFKWHVVNGLDRFILQFSGYSLIFIAIYFNKIKSKIK